MKHKIKEIFKKLDIAYIYLNRGDLSEAGEICEAIIKENRLDQEDNDSLLNLKDEQTNAYSATFEILAKIAYCKSDFEEAVRLFDKSRDYLILLSEKLGNSSSSKKAKTDTEYEIAQKAYDISVIYQNQKFNAIDNNNSTDVINEYKQKEREYLNKALDGSNDTSKNFGDQMLHLFSTCYYNLAKTYEAENNLENENDDKSDDGLDENLEISLKNLNTSLDFAKKVSKNYKPAPAIPRIESTKKEIKKAMSGINLLLGREEEAEIDEKKSSSSSQQAPRKKATHNELNEVREVVGVNFNLSGGLGNLSEYAREDDQSLWKHQNECIKATSSYLNAGNRSTYINMATGTGKTKVFTTLVKEMRVETIIVAPTNILVEQAASELQKIAPMLDIGIINGKSKKMGKNVTVITYSSFEKLHQRFKNAKLIILDEVHSSISEKRINAIKSFSEPKNNEQSYYTPSSTNFEPPVIIGFTATEKFSGVRKSLDYSEVSELLPCKIYQYTIAQGIEDKVLHSVKINKINIHDNDIKKILKRRRKNHTEGAELTKKELEVLKKDEINRVIPDLIANKCDPETGRNMRDESGLVFAVDIGHAEEISKVINKIFGENYSESIHSGLSPNVHSDLLDKHKKGDIKILVNVDMLTVGYDDKKLKFIIDFRPTKSEVRLTQTFGRITRKDDTNLDAKNYYQLIIPHVNLEVETLFGKSRLGEIHQGEISNEKMVQLDTGKHSIYDVTYSDGKLVPGQGNLASSPGYNMSSSQLHANNRFFLQTDNFHGSSSYKTNTYHESLNSLQDDRLNESDSDIDWDSLAIALGDNNDSKEQNNSTTPEEKQDNREGLKRSRSNESFDSAVDRLKNSRTNNSKDLGK